MMYTIRPGDTIYKIANQYGLSIDDILMVNPQIVNPDVLRVNQRIIIPIENNQPRNTVRYIVQKGDTLYRIAKQFNVSLESIIAHNPQITDPNRIVIGQVIYIPNALTTRIVDPIQDYGYDEMARDIGLLQQRYKFIQVSTIGQSVESRNLYAIRLGTGPREVHYNASFHANEWITTPVLMNFIEDYAIAYEANQPLRGYDVQRLYNETSLYLVPMVNPDGVELVLEGIDPTNPRYDEVVAINRGSLNFDRWKANIRGVDLNNQFPAFWEEEYQRKGITQPAPLNYPGPRPLSEPESIAMAEFTRQKDFRMVLAFHSQGEVIFWGYRDLEPPEAETIVRRFQGVSGYQPIRTVVSDAGYKDWFILEWRRPGFTVEVGRGINPLPIAQFPSIYENSIGIMLEALTL